MSLKKRRGCVLHNNISDAESFFETASKEELIDYLVKTIEKEVSKGDDADCDLVRECSDWLDELTEDEVTFTPEELERKLAQLKADSESKKPVKICKKAKLKTFVRVALIAAVIFAISIISITAVASNQGYNSTWSFIVSNVEKIMGLTVGDMINENGIVIIKNTGNVRYDNMESLLAGEKLKIMYPANMPYGVSINEIRMVNETENKYSIYFSFSDASYTVYLTNYYSVDIFNSSYDNIVEVNNKQYYIMYLSEEYYHAICQSNGYEYIIETHSYDDLMYIINNMKG